MDALLLEPEHSFIRQSFSAWGSSYAVNGDGVGVGWYGEDASPGLYRDTRPAWNDENLLGLSGHVRSHLFLAHVRATSGSAVQRTNCHPFLHDRWLFQHNGEVRRFDRLKRELDLAVATELYPRLLGSADSERMFFLALTHGLDSDPRGALARMAGAIEAIGEANGVPECLTMTLALADGQRLFAVRYSSAGTSPSLYYSAQPKALRTRDSGEEILPDGGVIVLSEPLDGVSEHWREVGEGTLLLAEGGEVRLEPFAPLRV